jgi:hypothetical protein
VVFDVVGVVVGGGGVVGVVVIAAVVVIATVVVIIIIIIIIVVVVVVCCLSHCLFVCFIFICCNSGGRTTLNTRGGQREGYSQEGVTGLKNLGVRDLTYKLIFVASAVNPLDVKMGAVNVRDEGATTQSVVAELTEQERLVRVTHIPTHTYSHARIRTYALTHLRIYTYTHTHIHMDAYV